MLLTLARNDIARISLIARPIRLRENNKEVNLGLINVLNMQNANRTENDLTQIGER